MSSSDSPQKYKDSQQDNNKREYGCPCGKTYLSYPALFTHVKQKHDGKAPGSLIKPKTEKARGRPKIHLDAPEDEMSDGAFSFEEELAEAIEDVVIHYNEQVKVSEGNRTCQDMVSSFLNKVDFLTPEQKKVVNCFLNELRHFVEKRNGPSFWVEERPGDIIDVVNDIYKGHEEMKKKYPLPKSTLIELLYVFFRWMYKSKWTDHKLIKRAPCKVI